MPDVLQDLALREHAARVEEEEAEEVELGCGELDWRARARHGVPLLVEHDVREAENVARKLGSGSTQDCLHASDELGQAERLRHVVVASRAQRLDLVLGRVLRGEEQHDALEALGAEAPADLDALEIGEHPVEHDQIGLLAEDGR